jgi:hypothetical protein
MFTCVHCGQPHPDEAKFCSATGQSIQPPTATERVRPLGEDKGVFDLFKEAAQLYKAHRRTFLITAAVLFVPGALLKSCALSAVAVPAAMSPQAVAYLWNALAVVINAFIVQAMVLPLTQGALTVATADALLGGGGDWRQHWNMVLKRLPVLLTTIVPAGLLIAAGQMFVVPGVILSFLFVFLVPVVLIERLAGPAAMKRSYQLVRSDLLRTALVFITIFVGAIVAHRVARVFVPDRWYFLETFLGDLFLLVLLPVFLITTVLLYFDLRRKQDGLDDEHLNRELETLRPVV